MNAEEWKEINATELPRPLEVKSIRYRTSYDADDNPSWDVVIEVSKKTANGMEFPKALKEFQFKIFEYFRSIEPFRFPYTRYKAA